MQLMKKQEQHGKRWQSAGQRSDRRTEPRPTKHIFKEGSRYHVLSWHGGIRDGRWTSWRTCSEQNCEVNSER